MKISIGIRVSPNQVYYAIVSDQDDEIEIKIVDKIVTPKALDIPEQLKFLRSTLLDIINENNVTVGCIRISESNAQSTSEARIYMEGVIQELIASSSLEKYYIGQISSTSAKLGIDRTEFKPFASNEETFMDIDIWDQITMEQRECLMAAISALNL